LDQFNIPVVAELEGVGQNIEDQVWLGFNWGVNVTTMTQILLENAKYTVPAVENYSNKQSGPLAGIGAGEFTGMLLLMYGQLLRDSKLIRVTGWEKLPAENRARLSNSTLAWLATFPEDWPEVEYQEIAFSNVPDDIGPDGQYMAFGVALLTPKSRGNVTLRSADTNDYPVITLNWLQDPVDLEVAIEAFRRQWQWGRGSGIVVDEFNPAEDIESDAQILAWLKEEATFIYYASCGCAMGKDNDTFAVLDSQARVRDGVSGLRVVDTSSFPVLVPGHPMATVCEYSILCHYFIFHQTNEFI
jgi:choline dehydrogenase